MSNDYGRPEPKLDDESLDRFIEKVRDANTPDDVLKRERQIKQLAEAIYKSLWDYKGLTRNEDMVPYFEDIIRKHVYDETKKEG